MNPTILLRLAVRVALASAAFGTLACATPKVPTHWLNAHQWATASAEYAAVSLELGQGNLFFRLNNGPSTIAARENIARHHGLVPTRKQRPNELGHWQRDRFAVFGLSQVEGPIFKIDIRPSQTGRFAAPKPSENQ